MTIFIHIGCVLEAHHTNITHWWLAYNKTASIKKNWTEQKIGVIKLWIFTPWIVCSFSIFRANFDVLFDYWRAMRGHHPISEHWTDSCHQNCNRSMIRQMGIILIAIAHFLKRTFFDQHSIRNDFESQYNCSHTSVLNKCHKRTTWDSLSIDGRSKNPVTLPISNWLYNTIISLSSIINPNVYMCQQPTI